MNTQRAEVSSPQGGRVVSTSTELRYMVHMEGGWHGEGVNIYMQS